MGFNLEFRTEAFKALTLNEKVENKQKTLIQFPRKITKIVINILQKNSDNERYLQNA